MTTVQIKAKQKATIHDNQGNILSIDATINEEHLFTSQATMHEIEGGDSISDHVVKKPIQLTLNGLISGDPIPDSETVQIDENPPGPSVWTGERFQQIGMGAFSGIAGMAAGGGAVGGIVSYGTSKYTGSLLQAARQAQNDAIRQLIAGRVGDSGPSPIVKTAYDILTNIYQDKLIVSIVTGLNVYDNMVMESLNLSRSKDTVRSLPFTASFKQIKITSSETVTIPAMTDRETYDRGAVKQTQGAKQATSVSDSVSSKGESLLYKIGGSLGLIN